MCNEFEIENLLRPHLPGANELITKYWSNSDPLSLLGYTFPGPISQVNPILAVSQASFAAMSCYY